MERRRLGVLSAMSVALWSLLKRLDTLLAAALLTFGLRVIPDKWLCAEVTCRSPRDAAVMALFGVTAAPAIASVFWRVTNRWWARSIALVAALYVSNQLPVWLGRHGTWNIAADSGSCCNVAYGMRQDEVRRRCGAPTYWCEGPKYIEALNVWNPVALVVCSFRGDVYGDRLITYDCAGGAASVAATSGLPPENTRPTGCVWWGR